MYFHRDLRPSCQKNDKKIEAYGDILTLSELPTCPVDRRRRNNNAATSKPSYRSEKHGVPSENDEH